MNSTKLQQIDGGLTVAAANTAFSSTLNRKPRPRWFTSTSPATRFRQRVEAIVEAFSSMQDDLDKECKVIIKQWAKRQGQIERVMGATVGMYGDLQGIAGKSLQEIEGLELPALEAPVANNRKASE